MNPPRQRRFRGGRTLQGWIRYVSKEISAWSTPVLFVVLVGHIMSENASTTTTTTNSQVKFAVWTPPVDPRNRTNTNEIPTARSTFAASTSRELSTTTSTSSSTSNVSLSTAQSTESPTVLPASNTSLFSNVSSTTATVPPTVVPNPSFPEVRIPEPSKFHPYNASEEMVWTFFYNLYVSPTRPLLQRISYEIITEQIGQVGRSYALQRYQKPEYRDKNITVYIYYNTIGKEFDHAWFRGLTQQYNLTAVHLSHYPTAHEDVTLQSLHDFCQIHEDSTVIYLHNKGSFHNKNGGYNQEVLRRLLTFSATHPTCLDSLIAPAEGSLVEYCQTCGLLFQPMPGFHYPGNMWAAKCSYIRQLHTPTGFDQRMAKMKEAFYEHIKRPQLMRTRFFHIGAPILGQGRYASEHWLGSHPNLTHPCHVSPSPRFTELTFNASIWAPDWPEVRLIGGPGFGMTDRGWGYYVYTRCAASNCDFMLKNAYTRRNEFFLLAGTLFKMKFLYQALPPDTSWVWRWFPDGPYWRRSVNTHPVLASEHIYNPNYTRPVLMETNETIRNSSDITAVTSPSSEVSGMNVSSHENVEAGKATENAQQ